MTQTRLFSSLALHGRTCSPSVYLVLSCSRFPDSGLDHVSEAAKARGYTPRIVVCPCHNDGTLDHHERLLRQFGRFPSAARDWSENRRQPIHQLFENLSYAPPYQRARLGELAGEVPHQASVSPEVRSNRLQMIEQTQKALVRVIHPRVRAACYARDAFLVESVQDCEPEFFLRCKKMVEAPFCHSRF